MPAEERFEPRLRAGLSGLLNSATGTHPEWATAPARLRVEQSRRARRPGRTLLLVAALVTLGLVGTAVLVGQQHNDDDRHGPSVDPGIIGRALDRLSGLSSYRYEYSVASAGGPSTQVRGEVVNGDPLRQQFEALQGTEVSMSTTQIGDQTWVSVAGSAYVRDNNFGSDSSTARFDASLREILNAGAVSAEDLGLEARNGESVRHIRAQSAGSIGAPVTAQPADAQPSPTVTTALPAATIDITRVTGGFSGRIDVWISATTGALQGAQLDGSYKDVGGFPGESPGVVERRSETITIDHVNDASNVITEPTTAVSSLVPTGSGDATLRGAVLGASQRLRNVDSYHSRVDGGMAGGGTVMETTVVNRPVQAAEEHLGSGIFGFSILIIGDEVWSRNDDEPYKKADDPSEPHWVRWRPDR